MSTDRVDIRIDVQQQGAEALTRINQEVGALSQSAAQTGIAFDRIQQDVREATIAIEQGAISSEDYAQALRFARQEANQLGISSERLENSIHGIQARFRGTARESLTEFTRRTEGVAVGLNRVNVAAKRTARQGLGTIRSSMASLTAMAIGTRGTLGTLASGILQFAAGNVIAIGAIAGIAAIAFAFRKLSSDAREAKKEIDDHIAALEKLREAEVTPLEKVTENIEGARKRLAEFNADLAKIEAKLEKDPGRDVRAILLVKQKKLLEEIAKREDLIAVGGRKRAEEEGKENDEREATLNTQIGLLTKGLELGILTTDEFKRGKDLLSDVNKELQAGNVILERRVELFAQQAELAGFIEQRALAGVRGVVPIGGAAAAGARLPDFGAVPRLEGPEANQALRAQIRATQEAAVIAAEVLESIITPQQRYTAEIAVLTTALPNAGAAAGDMANAIEILKGRLGETATQAEISSARIVLAFGRMAEEMIRGLRGQGGGLSGLIGLAGGLLSVVPGIGPLAGAGILTGSGILSALARSERPRVIVDEFGTRAQQQQREIRQGPDTIIVQLLDAQGRPIREIAADLRDLERRDGINRFSGTVQGTVTSFTEVG